MAAVIEPPSMQPNLMSVPGMRLKVAVVLTIWLVAVTLLAASGGFVSSPGTPPIAVGVGFAAPLIVFFAAFRLSHSFRAYVLTLDLRLITSIQAWRFAGFEFLALYAHHLLPAGFAFPAGLGDTAIGLTAPWVAFALIRRPRFAAGWTFRVWNALGILDLIVAIGTGAALAALSTGAAGEISTQPMSEIPLVFIPAYLVPIFLMLHITSLIQASKTRL